MKYLYTLLLILGFLQSKAQFPHYSWNFDGSDTVSVLKIVMDTTHTNNVWQIGKPQKTIFTTAKSVPNVLVTDTAHSYPVNDTSIFTIVFPNPVSVGSNPYWAGRVQFYYRLNMDSTETAKIELSIDSGVTWTDILKDSIHFTGPRSLGPTTDTAWRYFSFNCGDYFWGRHLGTNLMRFTFISDSVDTHKDGWMIDDLYCDYFTEGIDKTEKDAFLQIYPNPSTGNIYIKPAASINKNATVKVYDLNGKKVYETAYNPSMNYIHLSLPDGNYILEYKTEESAIRKKISIQR